MTEAEDPVEAAVDHLRSSASVEVVGALILASVVEELARARRALARRWVLLEAHDRKMILYLAGVGAWYVGVIALGIWLQARARRRAALGAL